MRLARLQLFAWKNEKLLEGRLGRVLSHCLQPLCKFQDVRCVGGGLCVGICRAMAPIGDAKQAMGVGKSGLVEI